MDQKMKRVITLLLVAGCLVSAGCSSAAQTAPHVALVSESGQAAQNPSPWYKTLAPDTYQMQGRIDIAEPSDGEQSFVSSDGLDLICAEGVGEAYVYHGFEIADPQNLLAKFPSEDSQVFDVVLLNNNGRMQLQKASLASNQKQLLARYENIGFGPSNVAGSVSTELQEKDAWVTFFEKDGAVRADLKKLDAKQKDSASMGIFEDDHGTTYIADITLKSSFYGAPMTNNLSIMSKTYVSEMFDYADGKCPLSIVAKDGYFVPDK